MSNEEEVLDWWRKQEGFYRGKLPVCTAYSSERGVKAINARASEFSVPVAIIHGSDDRCEHSRRSTSETLAPPACPAFLAGYCFPFSARRPIPSLPAGAPTRSSRGSGSNKRSRRRASIADTLACQGGSI